MSEREAFEAWIQRDLNYGYDLTRDVEGNYTHDATETAWFAWEARAAVQANAPDGWVLVPVEPTKEMLKNVFSECGSIGGGSCGEYVGVDSGDIQSIWDAMLSAIPKG